MISRIKLYLGIYLKIGSLCLHRSYSCDKKYDSLNWITEASNMQKRKSNMTKHNRMKRLDTYRLLRLPLEMWSPRSGTQIRMEKWHSEERTRLWWPREPNSSLSFATSQVQILSFSMNKIKHQTRWSPVSNSTKSKILNSAFAALMLSNSALFIMWEIACFSLLNILI